VSERRLHYTFGPLERRGFLGPLRAGQAGLLAAGALSAILILDRAPSAAGVAVATVVFAGAVALALAPLGQRTCEEWAGVAWMYAIRQARRRLRFRSPLPTLGVSASASGVARRVTVVPPDAVRDVKILEAGTQGRAIGAISERGDRLLTTVLACRVVTFSLLDTEAQERRLSRWGLVLSGAAGTEIRRIQWLERTVPAQGDELVRWLHAERDPAVPLRGAPVIESYLELIGATAQVAQEHEILIAVQIDARRVRERGREGAIRALVEQTEHVAQALEAAEVMVLGALSAGQLARTLRTAFDPYGRSELAALETADPDRDGLSEANAWPLGAREAWEHYQSDGAVHATYWIGGWPRVEVSPMFLGALLARSSAVRTVAVVFEPISPERSTREVETAITRDRADQELRHRFGQSETARQRQAQDAARRRESELAAGHGEVRFSGFVTVSGRSQDDLRRGCAEVLEHAARSRVELHRMFGQQAEAFTFTLPLCRGLK
jgi:Putative type VII ESX secretion system translocon, EccE